MSLLRNFNLLSVLANAFRDISAQYPIPTDTDSVYEKDIFVENSVTTDWADLDTSGEEIATIPFNNLNTRIQNTTATNPKILTIAFNRVVQAHQVSIGCNVGGDFSNVYIKLIGSGGVVHSFVNDSANNTKYTSRDYSFNSEIFNAITLEFHTADTVTISDISIQKAVNVGAQITYPLTGADSVKVTPQDSLGNEYAIDTGSNAQVIIDREHSESHKGNCYRICTISTLAAAATTDLLLATGAAYNHLVFSASVGADATVGLYEDITFTAGTGTLQTIRNKNRNSANTSLSVSRLNPTVTATGTLIQPMFIPGGSAALSNGGYGSERLEWVLKPNANYLLRITNSSTGSSIFNPRMEWYEVPV